MSPSSLAVGLTSVSVHPAPLVEGDARPARIMAIVDEAFLAEMGWDSERAVLFPPEGHRLVVRPVCQVDGCSTTATNARRICFSCQARLAAAGLGDDQVGLLAPPGRSRRAPATCVVAGCARERVSGPAGLCRAHDDQRRCLGVEIDAFVAHPDTAGLPALRACLVAAAPASAATQAAVTARPTSSGCVTHAGPTRPSTSCDGGRPSRRSASAAR